MKQISILVTDDQHARAASMAGDRPVSAWARGVLFPGEPGPLTRECVKSPRRVAALRAIFADGKPHSVRDALLAAGYPENTAKCGNETVRRAVGEIEKMSVGVWFSVRARGKAESARPVS
jgi:hypothetical protein